jgi:predicted methyltransferase
MKPLTQTVQEDLKAIIQPGDICVDATAGNGHDTLFLAEQVGQHGKVYAFDIQDMAIERTRERLVAQQLLGQVKLINDGHEHLSASLPDNYSGQVSVIMFNLGYLPGSDKSCITRPDSTVSALKQAAALIKPKGIISVMLYPNHEGGHDETRAVLNWSGNLGGDFQQEMLKTPGPQWLKVQKKCSD